MTIVREISQGITRYYGPFATDELARYWAQAQKQFARTHILSVPDYELLPLHSVA